MGTEASRGDRTVDLDVEAYLVDGPAELRRCAETAWCAHAVDATGAPLPIALSHDGVREVLRDRRLSPRVFTADMIDAGLSERAAHQLTPFFRRHGEEHRAFRGLLSTAFTPRSVERIRPTAAAVAGRLADDIAARGGECELVADFAAPLPPEVFAALFGLPGEDRDRIAEWGNTVIAAFALPMTDEELEGVETACAEMRDWGLDLIAERRARPGEDLVSRLVEAEVDGEGLTDTEIVEVVTGFVFAGAETTRRQTTAMVALFAEHPRDWERIAADPGLIPAVVEEVLRFRPIVPGMTRVAVEHFEDRGVEVPVGGRIVASFLTANLDDSVYDDPDRFDVDRPNADSHVTFGWGPHFCVGAPLARVELQEALRALTSRFGPPVLTDGPAAPDALGTVAPSELRVEFTPPTT